MPGRDAFGTILKRGDGAGPEVFTALGNATNLSGPNLSRDTLDVTSHDSPNRYREFVGGLINAGEVSIDINYDPDLHDVLVEDLEDTEPRNYQLVFPAPITATWNFSAVMTGFQRTAPFDNKLTGTLTFQVSGKPTIT